MIAIEMEGIKAKLKKLFALAERGIGGEKVVAEKKFNELLAAHNINIEDITEKAEPRCFEFSFNSKYEKKLIFQIYTMCINSREMKYGQKKRKLLFKMMPMEGIDAQNIYSILRRELNKEIKACVSAFIQVNRLFPSDSAEDDRKLSQKEIEEIRRMLNHAKSMEKTPIRKAMEAGK